ncbi:hypothetical protein Pcac1_g783 [Phytophthora cactorum]|nr:hypothetical protein Pcac1_g783 [Phytophthora cactorum]
MRGPSSSDDVDGEWLLRFDGACRANPGPGGAGAAPFSSPAAPWCGRAPTTTQAAAAPTTRQSTHRAAARGQGRG